MHSTYRVVVLAVLLAGCPPPHLNVQCIEDSNCNLSYGGVCTLAPTGNRWCAYPDPDCPSGYRYSDFSTGDDLNEVCVAPAEPPPKTSWVRQLGSTHGVNATGVAIDHEGNPIIVGTFGNTIRIGEQELVSTGAADIFVAKLARTTGAVIWAKRFGGTMNDGAFSVAIDDSQNVYIAGTFQGVVDFGSGAQMSGGESDGFVLKLDKDGGFEWMRPLAGSGRAISRAVVTLDAGVVIAGSFLGSMVVDGATYTSTGPEDGFILKLSASSGATSWIKTLVGPFSQGVMSATADNANNLVFVGFFADTVDFGGGPRTSSGGFDGFLLKLSSEGAFVLSESFGGPEHSDEATTVAVDAANNIFIAGVFGGSPLFGCAVNPVASQPELPDVFLVRYTANGTCQWVKGFGGDTTFERRPRGLTTSNVGEVAITGSFCGSISLGGPTLTSARACPATDLFVARLTTDGIHLNSIRSGGADADTSTGIVRNTNNQLFIIGNFSGLAEFDGEPINSLGGVNAFVWGGVPL